MKKEVFGNCTLYNEDCREVLPDLAPDMVFMDPPYGNRQNSNDLAANLRAATGKMAAPAHSEIQNDGDEALSIFRDVIRLLAANMTDANLVTCCSGGGGRDGKVPKFVRFTEILCEWFKLKQVVIWDKGPMGIGWHYRRSYEMILIGEKGHGQWNDATERIENVIRPGAYGIKKIIPQKNEHPTPKPWQLPAFFLGLHSAPGQLVVDPFMGGGSTGIAAAMMGRRFVGCEVDPRWFDLSCRRLSQAQEQMSLSL